MLDVPGYTEAVEIGRGGFGVVYRAQQPAYRRTVAIKVLRASLDGKTKERFERECMALGSLSGHPNIVTLFDAGFTRGGDPFIAMEYLGGGSLEDRVDPNAPVSWQEAVDAGVRLAGALHTAHQADVLHRDIKPRNVLMSNFGDLRLVDFGLARLKGSLETRQGDIAASVAYAAPEILAGQAPSVASDVYSLGATIFSLLWGRPPFVTDDEQLDIQVISRIATSPVPDARAKGVPDAVCRVLERAMAKDPVGRFASAEELGRALQAAQADAGLAVTPLPLKKDVDPKPVAAPSGWGSGVLTGQAAAPASFPAPGAPPVTSGETVRRPRPGGGPAEDSPDGAGPTAPPPSRPAATGGASPGPPARDREPLSSRLRPPETIGGRPAGLVVGVLAALLVVLGLGIWGVTRVLGGDSGPAAAPPREGRYRYRSTTTGDAVPLAYPESLAQVETASRSGGQTTQTTTTDGDDGSTTQTAVIWKPEGLFEDEVVRTKSGTSDICDWQPDIPLLRFPLEKSGPRTVEASCKKPFGVETKRVIRTRVLGSARTSIEGESVRVWNVERTETRSFLSGGKEVTHQELVSKEKFAPRYGLVVQAHVEAKTSTGGKLSQSAVDVRLLNLDPV